MMDDKGEWEGEAVYEGDYTSRVWIEAQDIEVGDDYEKIRVIAWCSDINGVESYDSYTTELKEQAKNTKVW